MSRLRFRALWGTVFALLMLALVPTQAAMAQRADTIVVAIGSDITTLEPHLTTDTDSASIRYQIYEGLVHTDANGNPQPELAESWEISDDGLTYVFRLRKGIKFHDGADFNAHAVKINFDRLLDPARESSAKDYMSMIDGVYVIDDYTVAFNLKEPFSPFLNHLGVHAGHIASPKAIAEMGENLGDRPAGTGPFRFVERVRGERIVLERWEGYWREKPGVKTIIYQVVPEASSRIAMLETGEADIVLRVTPEEAERLKQVPGIDVVTVQTARMLYFAMNLYQPPFNDRRVRQAANYAVNKEAIIEHILGGGTKPVDSPLAPAIFGYHPVGSYPYDPDKARQLLAEAGNPNPKVVMWGPRGRFPQDVEIAQVVQQMLQQVGFDVELRIWGDYPAYLATFQEPMKEHHLAFMGWAATSLDAEAALRQPFHGERAGLFINAGGFSNPEFDQLMDTARAITDRETRRELYRRASEIVMEEAPVLFMYYGTSTYGQRDRVLNVDYRPSEHVLLRNVQLKQ